MKHGNSWTQTGLWLCGLVILNLVNGTATPASAQAAPPPAAGNGVTVSTLTATLDGRVGGVAVDQMGYIYVADFGDTVWRVDPFGEVKVFADSLYGASGNAIDGQGVLYQASFYGNFIDRIARDGSIERFAEGLQGPVGLNVATDGGVFACECRGNQISRIDAGGTATVFSSGDLYNCPNGITRHPDGDLFVVNFSDGRMIRIDAEGKAELFATIPGGGNGHVAWAGDAFFVTGFRSNRVYRVSIEAEVSTFAGTGRFATVDGAPAESAFASPNGIAYNPTLDALYINDFLVPLAQRGQVPSKSVVRKIAFPTLSQAFLGALNEGGIEAAEAAYRSYKTTRQRNTEQQMNAVGYGLLQNGNIPAAVKAFRLNAESYPKSSNVYDSLGEGLKAAGDRKGSIESYRKSLELNPNNTNATKMLKELGADG